MSRTPSPRRPPRAGKSWSLAAAVAVLATACCAPPPSGPPDDIVVETDAFVREATPFTNYGSPTQPPSVLPTVECARGLGDGVQEFVFGYESVADLSLEVPLVDEYPEGMPDGPTNELRRTGTGGGTTVNEPAQQVVQFQPGTHPNQFSVRVNPGDSVEWFVVVPETTDAQFVGGYWAVTLRPKTTAPACGAEVPEHFAVVQSAPAGLAWEGPDGAFPQPERDPDGTITAYGIEVSHTVSIACSDGATGNSFSTLIGWSSDNAVVDPVLGTRQIVEPWGTINFQLTTSTYFPVVDITRYVNTNWPSTDVTGTCEFPGATAESSVYWSDFPGAVMVTWLSGELDNGDGTTTPCELTEPGCRPTTVDSYGVAPGGSRWR